MGKTSSSGSFFAGGGISSLRVQETVPVYGFDETDPAFTPLYGSFITGVAHNGKYLYLRLVAKEVETLYRWEAPKELAEEFLLSRSPGRLLGSKVKGQFPSQKFDGSQWKGITEKTAGK